jgi:predicted phage terminase large subunit-like protein
MLSIGATTWTLEKFPKHNVGLCTYGQGLSLDFSQAVRDQILANPDKLTTRIREGSNRADRYLTQTGGGVFAFGLGGVLVGRGFHVFFLDDYIKQLKEALSPTYRNQTWEWFVTTALTRIEPGGNIIIVATRWHDDDLIGRILKEQPEKWEYIRIPAIAEDDDVLGRRPGEALFPERYDLASLMDIKGLMGSHFWSAIYQQDPRADGSKIARKEWLQYVHELPPPQTLNWGRFWDLASTKNAGDFTVGSLFGANKVAQRGYIKEIVRGQYSPDDVEQLVLTTAERDTPAVPIFIEQEPGSSGVMVINSFKKLLRGYAVTGIPAVTNKIARAHAMLAGAERGSLILQHGAWNKVFADEFDSFPGGDYDDQIDTISAAWNRLIGIMSFGATWGRESKPEEAHLEDHSPVTGATWGRRKSGLLVPKGGIRVRSREYH